jgi:hypothetical protein
MYLLNRKQVEAAFASPVFLWRLWFLILFVGHLLHMTYRIGIELFATVYNKKYYRSCKKRFLKRKFDTIILRLIIYFDEKVLLNRKS